MDIWCPTRIKLCRSFRFSCRTLSDDRWLFRGLRKNSVEVCIFQSVEFICICRREFLRTCFGIKGIYIFSIIISDIIIIFIYLIFTAHTSYHIFISYNLPFSSHWGICNIVRWLMSKKISKSAILGHSLESIISYVYLSEESNELVPQSRKCDLQPKNDHFSKLKMFLFNWIFIRYVSWNDIKITSINWIALKFQ